MDNTTSSCTTCGQAASRVCRFCRRPFCELHAKEYLRNPLRGIRGEGIWCDECRTNWRAEKRALAYFYLALALTVSAIIAYDFILKH